jgi:hypothetical protein
MLAATLAYYNQAISLHCLTGSITAIADTVCLLMSPARHLFMYTLSKHCQNVQCDSEYLLSMWKSDDLGSQMIFQLAVPGPLLLCSAA